MSRSRLGLAAAAVALGLSVGLVAPAEAVTPNLPDPVAAATRYIAEHATPGTTNAGETLDALFGLVAGGADETLVQTFYEASIKACDTDYDPEEYPGMRYATDGGAFAAKCSLAASMSGDKELAKAYLSADLYNGNLLGEYDYKNELQTYVFGLGLEGVAFLAADMPVPAGLSEALLAGARDPKNLIEKPFGHQLDGSGLILTAIENLPTKDQAAIDSLAGYIMSFQDPETGLFPDWVPTNTTGMVASAVERSGAPGSAESFARALQGMKDAQVADGGFGLCGQDTGGKPECTVADTTTSDLRATNQGIFALADTTLLDLTFAAVDPGEDDPTAAPSPGPSETASPSPAPTSESPAPTADPSSSDDPTDEPSATASATPSATPVPDETDQTTGGPGLARTGGVGGGVVVLGLVATAAGAALVAKRK